LKDEELHKYIDYGVFPIDGLDRLVRKYRAKEGRVSKRYFDEIFTLIPESLRPTNRKGFRAYDGVNNTLSLGYRAR
jgi:CRISPR/Cas system-associated endonuclease Cas1